MAGRHDGYDHSRYCEKELTGLIMFLCLIALIPGLVIRRIAAIARSKESGGGRQFSLP